MTIDDILILGYEKRSRTLFSEWLTGGWQLGDLLFLEPIWKELVIRLGMYRTTANHQLSIIGVVIVNHRSCSPKHSSQPDDAGVSWRSYGPLLDHCKFTSGDPKNDCPKPLVACDMQFRTTVCQVWTWGWAWGTAWWRSGRQHCGLNAMQHSGDFTEDVSFRCFRSFRKSKDSGQMWSQNGGSWLMLRQKYEKNSPEKMMFQSFSLWERSLSVPNTWGFWVKFLQEKHQSFSWMIARVMCFYSWHFPYYHPKYMVDWWYGSIIQLLWYYGWM